MQPTSLSPSGWRRPSWLSTCSACEGRPSPRRLLRRSRLHRQLDSGLNNKMSLVVDTVYLCHVMTREVAKLLLNAGDVSHVRALSIGRNPD